MSDIPWFHTRLYYFCVIGEFVDAESRIYDGLVVDGYEFGHGMISQINSNTFRSMGLLLENI